MALFSASPSSSTSSSSPASPALSSSSTASSSMSSPAHAHGHASASALTSDASIPSSSVLPSPPFLDWLPDSAPRYICIECGAHLALQDELISKSFSGRDGKAYLFSSTLNTHLGRREDRHLLTGIHTVCDLSCKGCGKTLGWYYCKAHEASQKYKEGKSIMEKASLSKVNAW